jgi:hypothetical protein
MVIRLKKRTSLKLSKLFFLVVGIIVCLKTPVKAQATLTFDIAIRPQASGLTNSEGNTIVRDAFQQPTGLAFSNDGRKVFSSNKDVDGTHECISMMTLSTPYDLRTASLVVDSADPLETKASLTSNNDIKCTDIKFSKDGLKLFLGNNTGKIHGFDLAEPFDLKGLTYSSNVTSDLGGPAAFSFSNDGKKLIYLDGTQEGQHIDEYSLSTAYDLTSITLVNTITLTTTANLASKDIGSAVEFSQDGMSMFVLIYDHNTPNQTDKDAIFQFSLTTSFSTSTATLAGSITPSGTFNTAAFGMAFSSTGNKLYLVSNKGPTVNGSGTDVVTQIGLSCDYGLVACVSDPRSSLGSQVQLAKNNVNLNASMLFKRFEWIQRNRNSDNLNSFKTAIKFYNPLLNHLVDKLHDKVVVRTKSLKKKSNKDKKNNWSYWSLGDLLLGAYHGKSGGPGINLEKPKDIRTSGITLGADKKNRENNYTGFAIRYSDGKSNFADSGHRNTMESLTLNFYHTAPKDKGYTNMVVGLSSLKYDLITGGIETGQRNGKQIFTTFDLRTNSEYQAFFSNINLTPSIKFKSALTELSDFTEYMTNTSSVATNLIYKKQTFFSGDLAAGILFNSDPVKYTRGFRSHNGGLEFVYDFSPDITFEYSYAGSSNNQFYKVENYSQKNIRANYGFEQLYNNNYTLSLNYERFQHLDSDKFSHTESLFLKVGRIKDEDYGFAMKIDALQDYKISNYYLTKLGVFDFKISSNYNFMSEIPDYGAYLEISNVF